MLSNAVIITWSVMAVGVLVNWLFYKWAVRKMDTSNQKFMETMTKPIGFDLE